MYQNLDWYSLTAIYKKAWHTLKYISVPVFYERSLDKRVLLSTDEDTIWYPNLAILKTVWYSFSDIYLQYILQI